MFRHRFAGIVLAALALLSLPTIALADWPRDTNLGGVPVSLAANNQSNPMAVPDGSGGTIIAWTDLRSGANDIYAQRLNSAGTPLWTVNGAAVCTATGSQMLAAIVSDGAGGAILSWVDSRNVGTDIYAQRINSNGLSLWASQGVAVCSAINGQDQLAMCTDGAGGAILTWHDARGATQDIYAQRVTAAGGMSWAANGVVVCNAVDSQTYPSICEDGSSGAFIAWQDQRTNASTGYDIFVQHLTSAGTLLMAANGVAGSGTTGNQAEPKLVTDGAGGAMMAYSDDGSGTLDIYAQHILSSGVMGFFQGLSVCIAAGQQSAPVVASDGAGGMFVSWQDYRTELFYSDVFVSRVTASGLLPWTANGVPVAITTFSQWVSQLVSDGSGGVVVAWMDQRNQLLYDFDVYVQRIGSNGVTQWTSGGLAVCTAIRDQGPATIVANPDDSFTLAWTDNRTNTSYDIYAQRVDKYGKLGDANPAITKVKDVPNDQGGLVKVSWNASYLDADPTYGIFEYRVFRSVPGSIAGLAARRATTTDSDVAASTGALLVTPNNATATTWEYIGTQAAEAVDSYSRVCATTSDSIGGSNPRTYFMVEARSSTAASAQRWFSLPDSGYSVDNLGPAAPAPLTGQYFAGTTRLHWNPNTESDLDVYRVYRGTTVAFTPSAANLVIAQADTGAVDAAGSPYVYKVTAVDIHGNESPVATLIPSGTLGVEGAASPALSFATPTPNPVRGSTTLHWTLPAAGHVRVSLFDAAGRRVAMPQNGVMEAGEHSVTLALRDAAGRELPSGLYLARFEAAGQVITRRIAAVR